MISFPKLFLLVLVIGVVWFGWRWFQRVEAVRRELARRQAAPRTAAAPRPDAYAEPVRATAAEDMEKCPECGSYVAPRSATSCGRPGCPYGR